MFYQIKRHPIPIVAFFRHSLVLTYALPQAVLRPLLPPGLVLDTFGNFGFLAIALVQTESLRPVFLPKFLGQNFFLSGYRIFTRFTTSAGRTLRGLRILRSDTDRALMASVGNMLTHYHYRCASVAVLETDGRLEIKIDTPRAEADLHVVADLSAISEGLPDGSPFADLHQARLFAGPLPFTFDYEEQTHSIVMIEGVRAQWKPKPVRVEVLRNTFFEQEPFRGVSPLLANAFHVANVDYRWRRGVIESLQHQ
jgi:hypothetical protein